jgi:peptidoglycan/xylan/chitin deacetylase (PgdA/CDA1 family)
VKPLAMSRLVGAARSWGARAVANDTLFTMLDRAGGARSGGVILACHDMPTALFVEQIRALSTYRVVSLTEIVKRHRESRSTRGLLAITFDDGVRDVTHAAAKLAATHGWPITFYLPTRYLDEPRGLAFQAWGSVRDVLPRDVLRLRSGEIDLRSQASLDRFIDEITRRLYATCDDEFLPFIDELSQYLIANGHATAAALVPPRAITWDEVAALARDPLVSFESHGVSHQPVSKLGEDLLEIELSESQRRITECTNVPCRHFCYPYGGLSTIGPVAPRMVAKYYDSAVTMVRGRVGKHPPELLSRIPIYSPDTAEMTRLKVVTA